jgi:hypothetical protein
MVAASKESVHAMSSKIAEAENSRDDSVTEVITDTSVPQDDVQVFQVFFLTDDENYSVEVLETNMINFDEINQRLKMGESIFIKQKIRDSLESNIEINEENNSWYFNRC